MLFQMLTIFSMLSASISLFSTTKESQETLQELREQFHGPSIRVQLAQDSDGALVEVKGAFNIYDPRTGKKLHSAFMPASYYMYPTIDGIKWGSEFPGVYQLLLVPDKKDTTLLIAGTEYRGMGYLYQIRGTIGAVNEVSLEDFTKSILSTHIPSYVTEKEAIAALAIAFRTEALVYKQMAKNPYWDMPAATFGYRGVAIERQDSAFTQALHTSSGMVLMKNGALVSVTWFAMGERGAPYHEIQTWAKEGKDAREILEALFPLSKITKTQ